MALFNKGSPNFKSTYLSKSVAIPGCTDAHGNRTMFGCWRAASALSACHRPPLHLWLERKNPGSSVPLPPPTYQARILLRIGRRQTGNATMSVAELRREELAPLPAQPTTNY
ncbi:hypothetical protein B0T21DRAFT_370482 [Apiosordaria backusii]|uniref:Uncharacterized protein n=1 Tax=Apiosordaria backusii TaxID=314023 RepID=A0AA40B7P4_9PEZI|nr:hypothetical protein B0T21DRAFT_370482 [Apiosordaria backusii]